MDESPRPPSDQSPPPPPPVQTHTGSPTDFLKGVVGKRVIVRLTSGVDYKGTYFSPLRSSCAESRMDGWMDAGVLSCLDGFMNIALEQTEEHVNGVITNRYGDSFIRGNNVLYISAAEAL
ncbi:Sm-like ribonucleoprotein [Pholiota molesta]|nr:Sm-like ribonucleoprotein [Pholiota molesta]